VLGLLSVVLWAMNFVISYKYIAQVMRADNQGEGGILALLALVKPQGEPTRRGPAAHHARGVRAAALLYGDGVITPAISVLGATEGLKVITPRLETFVVPITVVILILLFWFQKQGTAGVGPDLGRSWSSGFVCHLAARIGGILREPSVAQGHQSVYAVDFFRRDGVQVIPDPGRGGLVLTGGEPSMPTWPLRQATHPAGLVYRGAAGLMLNYFGQGAPCCWMIRPRRSIRSFLLVPEWGGYPMVAIAPAAAIVAHRP